MKKKIQLKPIFGIKPEIYLLVFYGAILLLFLFSLLVLPGILKNGSNVEIWSNAQGAEFIVDGHRLGSVPERYFIERGNHEFVLGKPGFHQYSDNFFIRGRLFFSLFIPRREKIVIHLEPNNAISSEEMYSNVLLDMAAWGFDQLSAVRQAPPIFDEYALSTLFRGDSIPPRPPLSLIGSDQQLRDLIRGMVRLHSDSLIPNASGFTRVMKEMIQGLQEDLPETQLRKLLPPGIEQSVLEYAKYGGTQEGRASAKLAAESETWSVAESTALNNVLKSFGYNASLIPKAEGLIMSSRVNYNLFKAFMAENSIWREDAFLELELKGLSTENYFMHDPLARPIHNRGDESVRGINALSVFSFMNWLENKLDVKVRLPWPHELFAIHSESDLEIPSYWEFSTQYAQVYQSPNSSEQRLFIDPARITTIQQDILAGNKIRRFEGIQVQNNANETGILTPTMVSPVTTFRLVFTKN